MSDISIPGVSSKYNTPQLIENLMKVEKKKLETFEREKTEFSERKAVWQNINRKLGIIREAGRVLYGFDNPFLNKLGSSSDTSSVTVNATRQAQNGSWNLKVLQTAAADRFLSRELPLDQQIPAGNYEFTVGEKTVRLNYRGGKLNTFAEALNQRPENLVRATVVRSSGDSQVLLLESTQVGEKNRLIPGKESEKLLVDLGILGPNDSAERTILDEPVKILPSSQRSFSLDPPFPLKPGMILEGTLRITRLEAPPTPPAPPGLALPGPGDVTFEGITLTNDPLAADLPKAPPSPAPAEVTDFQLLNLKNQSSEVPLPPLPAGDGLQSLSIPVGTLLPQTSGLAINNRNTQREVEILSLKIRNPLESGSLRPLNPLSRAQDAQVEMDGIKITRPSNKLDDLVPGVTFNLEGVTGKTVNLKVEPDRESVKGAIINLVGNYNQFLTDLLVYTTNNPSIIEESYLADPKMAEQKKQALKDLGKFQGDITLNQMKSAFQRIFMDPYPTEDGSGLNLLSQIGISTNATGAGGSRPDASRLRGYLEINEGRLDQALKDNFESVKKLFGRDTTGDLVVDRGVGYSLDEYIRPYTQLAGLITGKIATLDGQITQTDKKIRDYNDYLVRYEEDLKRKYGAMESSLNSMQKSFDNIDNFTRQNRGE